MGMKVIKPKEFPKYMTTKTNYGKIMINLNPKVKHENKKPKTQNVQDKTSNGILIL